MAELVLDRLSLQELHVVDDEQVDVPQLLLQRQGIVVANGRRKAPHEIFGCQIDNARPRIALQRFGSDCLQKMRLAQADRRMEEERVEADRTRRLLGDRSRRREGNAIRWPFYEGGKCVAPVE